MSADQAVGIDLGLKATATTSDGEKLCAGLFYRSLEAKISLSQRRGHQRQAKRLHRTVLLLVVVEPAIGTASISRGGAALPRPPCTHCSIGTRLLFWMLDSEAFATRFVAGLT
jgi:hypothetical protein